MALIPQGEGTEPHIELELAGRPRTSLTPDFLSERWSSFIYLRPQSYQYYLPALLLANLNELEEERLLISGTLHLLTPSFWRLYHLGADKRFEYQISLFTPEQQSAVCSFLGLVFETLPAWRFRAAQTLKWGWNRTEHPALEQSREYYHTLCHYTYPPVDDPEQRQLVESIRRAFDARPYPANDRLSGSDQGDEPAEYALEFRGTDWRTLHPQFLDYHYPALSFFTDEAFCYFLPAFVIADVLGATRSTDPVFHLTHGFYQAEENRLEPNPDPELQELLEKAQARAREIDWRAYSTQRCAGFTRAEREAIIRYLEYSFQQTSDYMRPKIRQALESYWKPSLELKT